MIFSREVMNIEQAQKMVRMFNKEASPFRKERKRQIDMLYRDNTRQSNVIVSSHFEIIEPILRKYGFGSMRELDCRRAKDKKCWEEMSPSYPLYQSRLDDLRNWFDTKRRKIDLDFEREISSIKSKYNL